jgi:hypothetical protein
MNFLYPMKEWSILLVRGMFGFLFAGLANGGAVTANLPALKSQEPSQS